MLLRANSMPSLKSNPGIACLEMSIVLLLVLPLLLGIYEVYRYHQLALVCSEALQKHLHAISSKGSILALKQGRLGLEPNIAGLERAREKELGELYNEVSAQLGDQYFPRPEIFIESVVRGLKVDSDTGVALGFKSLERINDTSLGNRTLADLGRGDFESEFQKILGLENAQKGSLYAIPTASFANSESQFHYFETIFFVGFRIVVRPSPGLSRELLSLTTYHDAKVFSLRAEFE